MVGPRTDREPVDEARGMRLQEALRARHTRKLYGLALDLGVDQSAISRWKSGGAISLHHAAILCTHLDISLDWLVLGRGDMDKAPASERATHAALLFQKLAPTVQQAFLTILQSVRPESVPAD